MKQFILQKKKNKCFYINGKNLKTVDGTPLRDFISMEDVVNAHMECIKQDKNKIFWNKIYNIGINKGITVLQIINQHNKLFKKKIKYELIEQKKGERHQRPNGGEIVRFGCAHLKDHHSLRPSCTVSLEETDFDSQI